MQCERSLRTLGQDHIELNRVHSWDGSTPLEETLSVLGYLVDQGMVRYVGCSNDSPWHLIEALGIADREQLPPLVVSQDVYSPAFRDVDVELWSAKIDAGTGTLARSTLAGGPTSGTCRRDHPPQTGRHLSEWDDPPLGDPDRLWPAVDARIESGEEHGCSAAPASIAWLLARPGVATVIIGERAALTCIVEQAPRAEGVPRDLTEDGAFPRPGSGAVSRDPLAKRARHVQRPRAGPCRTRSP